LGLKGLPGSSLHLTRLSKRIGGDLARIEFDEKRCAFLLDRVRRDFGGLE
jgi:hypothetical protein